MGSNKVIFFKRCGGYCVFHQGSHVTLGTKGILFSLECGRMKTRAGLINLAANKIIGKVQHGSSNLSDSPTVKNRVQRRVEEEQRGSDISGW